VFYATIKKRNFMKVLFFNYEYPPLGGGAAYASQNIFGGK